jgi:adenosyl cobinamide kinase/adenosyl cobinamide phosphate guanylyltransferase
MVYDPIHGCVRGLPFDNEPKDRIDILEEMAGAISHIPPTVVRGKLRFMIGLQRSGKSTWATRWMRDDPRFENGITFPRAVVCADDIRKAVTGHRYNRRAEPVVFMVKDYMIEALLQRGHDVLVDGTHTTVISIRRNFEIDIDAQWTLINTPKEVCIQRALDTNQADLVPVLERTGDQLKYLLKVGIPKICENIQHEVRQRWNLNTVTEK